MERLRFSLTGQSPLILHNGQTCDPMNEFAREMKKISGKRGKTDADFEQMAKIEWYASLYLDDGRICIPDEVMEAALVGGAKKLKRGPQAKAGLFASANVVLDFDGCNLSVDELWERDTNRLTKGVRISTSRVMRTRFWVKEWQAIAEVIFDPGLLNEVEVTEIIRVTGEIVGVCDWRPKFGRFESKIID